MTTANEQFEADYLRVVMNDESAWKYVEARTKDLDANELAIELADEFEEMVVESTQDLSELNAMLIREMLIGQSVDVWYSIARTIVELSQG